MGHEIAQKCVYSRTIPMWHALVEPSTVDMSAQDIIVKKWNGGYTMRLEPVTMTLNGVPTLVNDSRGIVRSPFGEDKNDMVFAFVTEDYLPLQPLDVAKKFDECVKEPAETAAFLRDGREMFISWKMPDFEAAKENLKLYGIVRCGFDTMNGASLMTSIYRPVCHNTVTFAQNWANANTDKKKGKGNLFKGKATNHNLLRDLGYWMEHVQENAKVEALMVQSFFNKLAETPIVSDAQVKDIIFEAFPSDYDDSIDFPRQLSTKRSEAIQEKNESLEKIRDGIYSLFAGAGTAITPDLWGVMNATTEYFGHYQPSKRPIAESVMFGARQANTMQMVKVLSHYAG